MTRRGFTPLIVIGIIAILAVAGIVGYFLWKNSAETTSTAPQTPSSTIDTSGWQTYTNQQYGIAFKYPSEWGTPTAQNGLISIGDANAADDEGEYFRMDIVSAGNQMLDQVVAAYGAQHGVSLSDMQTTQIDGADARSFAERLEGGFSDDALFIAHGNYVYEISYGNRPLGDPAPASVLQVQALLATFQFVQAGTTATPSSSWLTYQDSQDLFSIRIPSMWDVKVERGCQ